MEVVAKLTGLRYEKRLEGVLNELIGSTPDMPNSIYRHSLERNCNSGNCFVTKYLPALISEADKAIQSELRGSAHVLKPEEVATKRYDMIVDALERMVLVGRYFDEANARSAKRTEAKEKIKNKLDLYRVASQNPGAVEALINFQTEATSQLLLEYAPFLAKLYLSLLAHQPQSSNILSHLKPGRKDYRSQRTELGDLVLGAEIYLRYSGEHLMWERDRKALSKEELVKESEIILDLQVEAIKNYSMLQLIRLGSLYIAPIRGTFTDTERRQPTKGADFSFEDMELIYGEMSNISNAVIDTIHSIASKHHQRLYGKPSSPFCLLLGGANARREFPSFDYDGMAVYEKEGKTEGGIEGSISNREYFNNLFSLIMEIADEIGHNFDTDFQSLLVESDSQKVGDLVTDLETFQKRIGKSNVQMVRTASSSLILAAGNEDLGKRVIDICSEQYRNPAFLEEDLAWSYARRLNRRKEYSKKNYNVKYSAGGLRDINDAIWMNNSANGVAERNILRGIDSLALTSREKKQLKGSYFYLINLRIRLDFYYGRNNKDLPQNGELKKFVHALGYEGSAPVRGFREDYNRHRHVIKTLTDKAIGKILSEFPNMDDTVKKLQTEYLKRFEEIRRKKVEIAEGKREKVAKKIEEDAEKMCKMGADSIFASLWAEMAAKDRGEEL